MVNNFFECLKDQCRSPVACSGFGYCRERNLREVPEDDHTARLARMRNRLNQLSERLKREANPELRDIATDLNEIAEDRDP